MHLNFRQCSCFDEMSLDGTIAYDPALDQIFVPNKNMLVIFDLCPGLVFPLEAANSLRIRQETGKD